MLKNKIAAAGMAGMLAMSLGLVACGGSNSPAAEESTVEESTSATSTEATGSEELGVDDITAEAQAELESLGDTLTNTAYWEGTLEDGSVVDYFEDVTTEKGALSIAPADGSDAKVWGGTVAGVEDGDAIKCTITNEESGETINYTMLGSTAGNLDTIDMDIEGYGQVTLHSVTVDEFNEKLEGFAKEVEEQFGAAADTVADAAAAAEAVAEGDAATAK